MAASEEITSDRCWVVCVAITITIMIVCWVGLWLGAGTFTSIAILEAEVCVCFPEQDLLPISNFVLVLVR